jgi:hypothetical protein
VDFPRLCLTVPLSHQSIQSEWVAVRRVSNLCPQLKSWSGCPRASRVSHLNPERPPDGVWRVRGLGAPNTTNRRICSSTVSMLMLRLLTVIVSCRMRCRYSSGCGVRWRLPAKAHSTPRPTVAHGRARGCNWITALNCEDSSEATLRSLFGVGTRHRRSSAASFTVLRCELVEAALVVLPPRAANLKIVARPVGSDGA